MMTRTRTTAAPTTTTATTGQRTNNNFNKRRYRDRHEVIADILAALSINPNHGLGITHLIYHTNCQWHVLGQVLKDLIESDIVTLRMMPALGLGLHYRHNDEYDGVIPAAVRSLPGHRVFFITAKGIKLLELYKTLKAYLQY